MSKYNSYKQWVEAERPLLQKRNKLENEYNKHRDPKVKEKLDKVKQQIAEHAKDRPESVGTKNFIRLV